MHSVWRSSTGRRFLLRNSQYDAAFPQFQQLIKENASAPFLHYAYGTALLAVSKFDEAAAQMQQERTIWPTSELPCVRLASIALRQHNFTDAIAWSNCALLLSANSTEAHYLLGRASLESGDNETALRELEAASRLSPASPEIHSIWRRPIHARRYPRKPNRSVRFFHI